MANSIYAENIPRLGGGVCVRTEKPRAYLEPIRMV
jgi:hypothetical protein